MNRLLVPVLLFIPLAAAQLLLAPIITFNFIGPDFLAIIVTYYGVRHGHIFGSLYGFGGGLLFDLISGGLLGASMFAYTITGFIAGYFYKEDEYHHLHSFQFMAVVLLTSSIGSFIYSLFSGAEINSSFLFLLFEEALLPGLYTSLLSFPVLFIRTERGIQ